MKTNCNSGRLQLAVLILVLSLAGCSRAPQGPPQTLGGVVKDAAGKPVAGAFVRVEAAAAAQSITQTVLVISQADGAYRTPTLRPGSYIVQSFGGEWQSAAAAPVAVSAEKSGEYDVTLNQPRPPSVPETRVTQADYESVMPEGEGKQLIVSHCIHCHVLDRIVPTRHTPAQWTTTVDRMSWFIDERSDLWKSHGFKPLTSRERTVVRDYLGKNFGMDAPPFAAGQPKVADPTWHLPRIPQSGATAKYFAVEFDLGASSYETGLDAHGDLWITEGNGNFGILDGLIFEYTRLSAPAGVKPRVLAQIAEAPDGNIWMLDNGPTPHAELLRYTPATKEFKTFPISAPAKFRAPLNTLRFLDGNLWGTGNSSSRVVKMDMATGAITDFSVPKGSHPYGIAIGGEGTVWYTGNYNNAVGKVDPGTGKITTYKLADHGVGLRRMAADAEGNLWVGAQDSNQLIRVDYRTGDMAKFDVPTANAGPYAVDVDKKNTLVWFTERDADRIGRFNPKTGEFAEFALPSKDLEPRRVFVDPVNPRRVWWSGVRIGYLEVTD